ncbi:MAG: prolyl oligopeptidase family serine peptidase [Planctomycetota bacterium]|nr:prolyl oligopeptidase family serine peptidase [Planctomycetota bacterium]
MRNTTVPALAAAGLLVVACAIPPSPMPPRLAPPETRSSLTVDMYGDTPIVDRYRWLEDQDSEEVLSWADRQNAYTESFLSGSAERGRIRDRLTELWNFERFGAPSRHGPHWVWSKNDGLQNQAVLYVGSAPWVDGRVLLDPNTLSEDGTTALGATSFSEDGSRMAFSTSDAGSDWVTWQVLDVATGGILDDRLEWSKFSGASWTHDGAGFFYQSYPAPKQGEVYEAATVGARLCYHRIGSPQSDDMVVYERPDHPSWGFAPTVTDDGRHAIVSVWEGTDTRNRVAVIDLADPSFAVRPLLFDFDGAYDFIEVVGDEALFVTDVDAPNGRILAVDLADPSARREVVAESEDKLQGASILGGELVARYLVDAHDEIHRFALDGAPIGVVSLPGVGAVAQLSGRRQDRTIHVLFSSFTRPGSVYSFDMDSGTLEEVRSPSLPFDPDAFVVRQVALQGQDGTPLKLFLVHRRDLKLDGNNPTLLYGYGGFDVSLTPRFSVQTLVFCEEGGVYAQATLRGGGEYGQEWHEAGMLERKQNVFDDFVSCARYLIRNDYTRPERLAINGGSNGGLLVGACLVQHPELFGAAIPEVGVLDMLRYHEFTIGWAWAPEYGRSDDPAMFPVLRAYSPLHNVADGASYPPTLVMTGDHDDRVLPGHSYKFAARLQAAQAGDAPVLLRVTRKAGHGAGKPTKLRIEEAADRLAFLGLTVGKPD